MVEATTEIAGPRILNDDRTSPRYPVNAVVMMAPYYEGEQPRFVPVVTRDLSAGGMSFFARFLPKTESVIIDMSRGEPPVRLIADVVRAEPANPESKSLFLVACRFRSHWPTSSDVQTNGSSSGTAHLTES